MIFRFRRDRGLSRGLALAAALTLAACVSGGVRAAKSGDLPALAAQIQSRIDDGSLTNGQTADIARAVAEREIEIARGKPGVARIAELRACARDLDDALEAREKNADEVGVEAAWARALYGELDEGDARDYASATDPRLRAIAVLSLVDAEGGPARRKAMIDPLLEARRAVMRASQKARDPSDVPALAEAVRLDPDPLVRTDALRALASIGGTEVAARLRDLWTVGDDGLRGDIGFAWTRPSIYPHGGEEALRVIFSTQRGAGAIEAAAAVLRTRPRANEEDAPSRELREMAVALYVRSIGTDARRARLHALATAPLGTEADLEPIIAAVRAASKDEEIEIRLAALSRLLEVESDRARAIAELEPIAGSQRGQLSRKALFSLAAVGHLRIQAWLERDLRSPDAQARLSAAVGLVALGRAPRGAIVLADADPSVRTRASCILLGADRRR